MGDAGRILACGGHDFDRRSGNEAITDLIIELAGGAGSRICLLPTASGDPDDQITRFRRAISERDCEPSVLSLFRLGDHPVSLREELLSQDAIFVGGGSMVNLVAVWRAHGVQELLAECGRRGILLSGQSAGAMCWFEQGITSSSGSLEAAPGFGLLPGSLSVHYRLQPARRRSYLRAVADGRLPGGLGLEDQTAVLFEGRQLREAVTARRGALALSVGRHGSEAVEEPLRCRRLESARLAIDDPHSEIIELRQTLAVRAAARRGRRGAR